MTYKFTILGRLDGLNNYIAAMNSHYHRGAALKKSNQGTCEWSISNQLRGVKIKNPVRIIYRWFEPNKRRDLDNISSGGRKVIQDALVARGVLGGDGWKQIVGFSDEFFIDRECPRIEIDIVEVKNWKNL